MRTFKLAISLSIFTFAACAAALVGPAPARAAMTFDSAPVAAAVTANDTHPDISGRWVVYQKRDTAAVTKWQVRAKDRWADSDVLVAGGGSGVGSSNAVRPRVWGHLMAYQTDVNGNQDVVFYDLSAHIPYSYAAPGDQTMPDISSKYVVWLDTRYGAPGVAFHDLSNGHDGHIPNAVAASAVRVDNAHIIYVDTRVGVTNLYGYDPHTNTEWLMQAGQTSIVFPIDPALHNGQAIWTLRFDMPGPAGGDDMTVADLRARTSAVTYFCPYTGSLNGPQIFNGDTAWSESTYGPFNLTFRPWKSTAMNRMSTNANDDADPALFGRTAAFTRSSAAPVQQDVWTAAAPVDSWRLSGADRYATAVEVSKNHFGGSPNLVLASGEKFPDALSAAPLAGVLDCPLLLTKAGSLPAVVQAEVTRLHVTTCHIVGGTGAVSQAVANWLTSHGVAVTRISGADRYETSALVARMMRTWTTNPALAAYPRFGHEALFASGVTFADALAAAPIGAAKEWPVLLVKTSSVPTSVASAVDDLDITGGFVVGGNAAIDNACYVQIGAALGQGGPVVMPTRWAGADRYATAVAAVEYAAQQGWIDLDRVGLASGTSFPDALAGGAALGVDGCPVLLTKGAHLVLPVQQFLAANPYDVGGLEAFGGPTIVSETARAEAGATLTH